MRRPSKSRAVGPDRHYQLPIVDLVTPPDPVVQAAQLELQELDRLTLSSAALLSDILERSRKLGEAIDSLKAAGRCPDPLWHDSRAFFLALGLHTVRNPSLARARHDHSHLCHDHDEDVISHNGGFQGGADSHLARRESGPAGGGNQAADVSQFTPTTLAPVLESMGFRNPQAVLHKYGPHAVQKAIDRLNARPSGSVANQGAYLRAILNEVQG